MNRSRNIVEMLGVVQPGKGKGLIAKVPAGDLVGQCARTKDLESDIPLRRTSRARYTSPIPPAPISSRIR